MTYEPIVKKPGDVIRSDEWNRIQEELVSLRKYIDNMARGTTLIGLPSPIGNAYSLSAGVPEDFNYGTEVMGLINRQYYCGMGETGDICTFGLNDYADTISYWSGASSGDKESLQITIEYIDGSTYASDRLMIHEWTNLRPKGNKNPYVEYLQSPNQRLWYRYVLVNPGPDKAIRYIVFKDVSKESGVRIANVLHYTARIRQLPDARK